MLPIGRSWLEKLLIRTHAQYTASQGIMNKRTRVTKAHRKSKAKPLEPIFMIDDPRLFEGGDFCAHDTDHQEDVDVRIATHTECGQQQEAAAQNTM